MPPPQDLKQYYEYYLSLHQNRWCRRLHFMGQVATLLCFSFIIYSGKWLFMLALPFIVYPFAWTGHYLFEKNHPAAFSDPAKAKICDWMMFRDMIIGRIEF